MQLDRTAPPMIKYPVEFEFSLPSCDTIYLDNGIPMYSLNLGAQEVVQVEWVFEAGIREESKTAVAQTTAALLRAGTATRSSAVINEAIEKYGATLKVTANNDFAIISITALTKHLHHLLPIVQELISKPSFPQDELQVYQQNAIQRLRVNLLRSDFVSNRLIDAYVFGKQHPYGRYTEIQDVEAITREDLIQFHQDFYTADNCKIFLSGNFTPQHVVNIQELFGGNWDYSNVKNFGLSYTLEPATEKLQRVVNDAKSVQGSIRLARPFIERTHPDFAQALVMNTIFGGYFGSRLMTNIREEKGYTYGIYSQFYAYKNASAYLIATDAGKDVCEAAVKETLYEAKRMQGELVSEQELILVKNYILGNLLGDLDGAFSIMSRWKTLILNDLTVDHFNHNVATYKSITAEQVRTMAEKYLNMDDFYNLIVY